MSTLQTLEVIRTMELPRTSGILLHPTSLPGPFGIGDLSPEAYRFVDFLAETGQGLWQILPLGHTSYGNSPYMCLSAFGGNPFLISLETLVEEGLLEAGDIADPPPFPHHHVDYGWAIQYKMKHLKRSFENFTHRHPYKFPDEYYEFSVKNAFWLEDYALFTALKEAHNGRQWTLWDENTARRDPETMVRWRNELAVEIRFWKFLQYQFFKQWKRLKEYCQEQNILVVGDVPVYVAHDSAEVWANRDLFYLDEHGHPLVVAGVPPDYFSSTGQRWGNPIYRWEEMARRGFRWWIDRFRMNFAMADSVRLDHFREFEAYWEIPGDEQTAVNGRWVKGPGAALFQAAQHDLGNVPMIAEDLGVITPEVDTLREELGFPGMRILQMAFGDDPKGPEYRPHRHVEHCAVYTGTHDHNTTVGWFTAEPGTQTTQTVEQVERERRYALKYIGTEGEEIHWDFIRLALGSVARLAVFPLQDLLGLGTKSRMNLPGTVSGNWEWRFKPEVLSPEIRHRLRELTELFERKRPVSGTAA
ncbi:MAG: 4-alpha-glucanotransferase [Desulfohalobiaceae bacterium]|nr:4-alpha-glucanotransferase [Desulfohalobiaceae bacterium]